MTKPKTRPTRPTSFKPDSQCSFVERQLDILTRDYTTLFQALNERLSRLETTAPNLEAFRSSINRLAKEAVMLQLGLTPSPTSSTSLNDDAPLHGSRWADSDERRLLGAFNAFVRAQSVNLGRTESGIVIRLLRTLKHERPIDWQVAGR